MITLKQLLRPQDLIAYNCIAILPSVVFFLILTQSFFKLLLIIYYIHREEAKQMWEKMEREWEFERMARKRLIDEVVSCQRKQVNCLNESQFIGLNQVNANRLKLNEELTRI